MHKDVIHGDVSMHSVDPESIPSEVRHQLEHSNKVQRVVLATGEATGHAHVLTSDVPFSVVMLDDERSYALLEGAGLLDHTGTAPGEGHGTRTLSPSYYEIVKQREFDPVLFERRVID